MSKAFKCDKCEKYFDSVFGYQLVRDCITVDQVHQNLNISTGVNYTVGLKVQAGNKELEVCNSCLHEIKLAVLRQALVDLETR